MSGFDRDRHLKPLLAGGLVLLLLAGIWLYSGYRQMIDRAERKVRLAQQELSQLRISLQEYRELEQRLRTLRTAESAKGGGNLITTVEDATQRISARNQLIYVRPQPNKTTEDLIEEGVEIKLEKLKLNQLVELLFQFEQSAQNLKVSQLRVRTRFDDSDLLDTSIILSRLREKS